MKCIYWIMMIGGIIFMGRVSLVWGEMSATIVRFNTQVEYCLQGKTAEEKDMRWSQLWDIMDELIIESLNAEKDLQSIRHLLAQLAGYKAPQTIQSERINNAVFSTGIERPYPNYALLPLSMDDMLYYIGIYNDMDYDVVASWENRLSIYSQSHKRWIKTDSYEGAMTLLVYLVPILLHHHVLITIEEGVGGDHIEGDLKIWRFVPGGKLTLYAQEDSLLDYAIQSETNLFTMLFTEYPHNLCESFLGTRILYELQLAVDDGQIQKTITCLNPWVGALNEYFGAHKQKNLQQANMFVKDPQILGKFTRENCSDILQEEGDLERGTGRIELMNGWRIDFEQSHDQQWIIINAQESK